MTKTGAGATLLEDPDRACRIVAAIAGAVDVPVTVKLRRGIANGSRACLELGPRLVEAGAASLTLHPRSAQQMYTGTADHSLTAELVSLVDVPVIASGDVTSRARRPDRARDDGRGRGHGRPRRQGIRGRSREIVDGDAQEPSREEVAAELVLFVRETVRELGERRAAGSSRSSTAGTSVAAGSRGSSSRSSSSSTRPRRPSARLLAAAPAAFEIVERLEAEVPPGEELTLELPVSIYGGG